MKKCFVYLLLAALSCYGLFACRSFKKSKSTADSTVTRSAFQKEAWQSQSATEIVIEADDLSLVQPGLSLPAILGRATSGMSADQPGTLLEKLGFATMDSNQVKTWPNVARPPSPKKGQIRLTVRKLSRQSSTHQSQQVEEKQVSSSGMVKTRDPSEWGRRLSYLLVFIVVAIVAAILYQSKTSD